MFCVEIFGRMTTSVPSISWYHDSPSNVTPSKVKLKHRDADVSACFGEPGLPGAELTECRDRDGDQGGNERETPAKTGYLLMHAEAGCKQIALTSQRFLWCFPPRPVRHPTGLSADYELGIRSCPYSLI
jgi:hypothetical protein